MIARGCGLVVLVLANWLVWRPPGADLPYDLDGLRAAMTTTFTVQEERFPPSGLLPDDYLLLLAQGDQPLRSIYVGFYPTQGLAIEGPHDPHTCYAVQGWEVGTYALLELDAKGRKAAVQTVLVDSPDNSLFVTWWLQRPGQMPVDPASRGMLDDLLERWRRGRSDLAWVRIEWDPTMADAQSFPQLQDRLVRAIEAVDRAFHR